MVQTCYVTFLDTNVTFFFFKEDFDIRTARAGHTVFQINFPDRGLVLVPYLNVARSHWLLFIINFENNACAVIDSMPESTNPQYITEERRVMLRFINYITECKKRGFSNALDSYNCGPFTIWEMDTLARIGDLNKAFDPNAFRVVLIKMLLKESGDVTSLFLYCYGEGDGPITVCNKCQIFYHHSCLDRTGMIPTDICWPCLMYG
ncbi:hypothetical protein QAD02_012604 [Eretmocerus hayati]|uniref:Uncharacterized protein n=1 Tax=Eretmocerus hayati TaxID=131215 RepID=A0ACC2P097_9HYME|nr:hypothetical protein QAD02_012604 [Eretmocerus hayati]